MQFNLLTLNLPTKTEVTGEHHVPAALSSGKDPPIPTGYYDGWAPPLVWTLQAIEPRFLGCPVCSTVTVLTELPTAHSQSPHFERPASSPNCQINCPSPSVFCITFSFFHKSSPPYTYSNQVHRSPCAAVRSCPSLLHITSGGSNFASSVTRPLSHSAAEDT